jgi:hypothetical protein
LFFFATSPPRERISARDALRHPFIQLYAPHVKRSHISSLSCTCSIICCALVIIARKNRSNYSLFYGFMFVSCCVPGVDGGELIRSSSRDSLNSVNHAPANHTPHMAREGSLGGAGVAAAAAAQSNGIADK